MERLRNGVDVIRQNIENKRRVYDSVVYAIQETSLLHKMGKGVESSAMRAVRDDIEGYQGPKGEKITDLQNIARDAAEGIFLQLGYDQPEVMADFDTALQEQVEKQNA